MGGTRTHAGSLRRSVDRAVDGRQQGPDSLLPDGTPDYKPASDRDLLADLFAEASELKIDVYLGLQANSDWDGKYANDPDWLEREAGLTAYHF